MKSGLSEQVRGIRQFHQFGNPISRSHQRLQPFDASHSWLSFVRQGQRLQFSNPVLQARDRRFRIHPDRVGHPPHILPDIRQRIRLKRNDFRLARQS